jgi:very-short-patch-repair endonuclease
MNISEINWDGYKIIKFEWKISGKLRWVFFGKQIVELLGYKDNYSTVIKGNNKNEPKVDMDEYLEVKSKEVRKYSIPNIKINQRSEILLTEKGVCSLIQKSQTLIAVKKESLLKQLFPDKKIVILATRKEIEFIDMLEKILEPFGYEGIRQYNILNYKIDLYIPSINIAIEYDENNHNGYTYEQQDHRQIRIEKELKCKFIRVSDKKTHLWNCGYVIKQIQNIIIKNNINI